MMSIFFDPCLYCTCVWNPLAGREVEIRSQDEWRFSVSREKTHVMHQIGVDIAVNSMQQNLTAYDTNDPPRQSWVGAENSSFICTF